MLHSNRDEKSRRHDTLANPLEINRGCCIFQDTNILPSQLPQPMKCVGESDYILPCRKHLAQGILTLL